MYRRFQVHYIAKQESLRKTGSLEQMLDTGETVRVAVVLAATSEGKGSVVIREDGHSVDYTSAKDEQTMSFSFDQAVTAENVQRFHRELLQPLTESIPRGYNAALLICGASTEEMSTLTDQSIIKEVLTNLSRIISQVKEELLITASFLQFHPDGSAVDLLSPNKPTLKPVTHPVLGGIVRDLSEVCLGSMEEAFTLYGTCRETLKANASLISSRCSFLFTVAVEWKLHPEEVEFQVCRSRLQLFSLAGGASRTDLRGVNPLVKVLDQIQCESLTTDKLLPFLLHDALTGNSRTVLLYRLHPQDEDTASALALARMVRNLETKAAVGCWCPRATEREIRDHITDLRNVMMSDGENGTHNTYRLTELTQNLQIVKDQSWEKRREESEKIKVKLKRCQTPNSNWPFSGNPGINRMESSDTVKYLQEQLRQEMEDHIKEDEGNVEKVQERIARIQQLRAALGEETQRNVAAAEKSDLCQHYQLEQKKAKEQRRQLKEDYGRLIQEEVEKMERDLAQEQLPTEGPQRELLVLTRERRVLVLQIEALCAEARQAETDLQEQQHRHQTELHCLREESLQVFRVFRQVSEELRKASEGRYRGVLLEAVQDAVYLSAQNQQLQADNKQLREALGQLRDTLVVRRDPITEV